VHAHQLSASGGVQAGVKAKAVSVDHLECAGEAEIRCLAGSATLPVVLPGAAFFLGQAAAPARRFIDAGLPLAVATDYNPGSCPSGSMPFMISLLCIQYKLTPEEAVNAATVNAAHALDAAGEAGCIAKGLRADFFMTRPMQSVEAIPYSFTTNPVDRVFLGGVEQTVPQ
jgi:imidazolonepropionase